MKFHNEASHKKFFSNCKFVKINPLNVTPYLKGVNKFIIYVPYLLINLGSVRYEISPYVVQQFECSAKRNGASDTILYGGMS
jgi:hypothetical protein